MEEPTNSSHDSAQSHIVYRQGRNGDKTVITIQDVRLEYEKQIRLVDQTRARNIIIAGGLYCSHHKPMTFVMGTKVSDHFRHITPHTTTDSDRTEGSEGTPIVCSCAGDDHLRAQIALRDNDYRAKNLVISRFNSCKMHTMDVFESKRNFSVRLEVREINSNGKRFVTDVAFVDDNKIVARIEVWKTHRTSTESRGSIPFFEIRADHILDEFRNLDSSTIRLRAECSGELPVCHECIAIEEQRRRIAQQKAEREAEAKLRFEEWLAELRVQNAEAERLRKEKEAEAQERAQMNAEEEAERERLRAEEEAERKRLHAEKRAREQEEARLRAEYWERLRAERKAQEAAEEAHRKEQEAQRNQVADLLASFYLWFPTFRYCLRPHLGLASLLNITQKGAVNKLFDEFNVFGPDHFERVWSNGGVNGGVKQVVRCLEYNLIKERPTKKQKTQEKSTPLITDYFLRAPKRN